MALDAASADAIVELDTECGIDLVNHALPSLTPLATDLPDRRGEHHSAEETEDDLSKLLKNGVQSSAEPQRAPGTPWFAWPLLISSLVAVSSAAVVFASIPDVPTFTLAAWRLQLTTLLLTPAACYQYRQLTPGTPECGLPTLLFQVLCSILLHLTKYNGI